MMMICPGPFHNLHSPCSYERTFELALRMHELPVPYSGREGPWHNSSHRTKLAFELRSLQICQGDVENRTEHPENLLHVSA